MAVLDSGCTQTVCGKTWLNVYYQSLDKKERDAVHLEESERTFRFGDGIIVKSKGKVKIPIFLKGVTGLMLETDIVDKEIPLLLSRGSMRRAGTAIQLNEKGNDTMIMFNIKQQSVVSGNGHSCLPLTLNKQQILGGMDVDC